MKNEKWIIEAASLLFIQFHELIMKCNAWSMSQLKIKFVKQSTLSQKSKKLPLVNLVLLLLMKEIHLADIDKKSRENDSFYSKDLFFKIYSFHD